MVSPTARRESVRHLRRTFQVSERRACRAIDQPRSSQRYQPKPNDFAKRLIEAMHKLVLANPRYGYRMITNQLRAQGFEVNPKRIYRLWRQEGFKVPRKARKRRFFGSKEQDLNQLLAKHPNDVWAWDFLFSRDESGRLIKWLALIDEYTRECLLLEGARNLPSEELRDLFLQVVVNRGAPNTVRSDNGPEFVAKKLREALELVGSSSAFIEPGAPWQNGYAESFNSRLRDEFLNVYQLADLKEARAAAARWKDHYNFDRPHSSLGGQTPTAFAAAAEGSQAVKREEDREHSRVSARKEAG